ncbi:hypothetical protein L9F63_025494, partial [Diploptera punctata]
RNFHRMRSPALLEVVLQFHIVLKMAVIYFPFPRCANVVVAHSPFICTESSFLC